MNTENNKSWFAKRNQALTWLKEQFPLAFLNTPKPLKVGIHQDVFNSEKEGIPAKRWIRYALGHYVKSHSYLKCLNTGLDRLNLQGMPHGQVSEQEAIQAKNELNKQKQRNTKPAKKQNKVNGEKDKVGDAEQNIPASLDLPSGLVTRNVLTLKKKKCFDG